MIDFLLKSTLSLGLLYAVYYFLLEKEKMHHFKRFFLLFSLIFSFVVPFVTFEIIAERVAVITQNAPLIQPIPTSPIVLEETTNYLPMVLWSVYVMITFLLTLRFIFNLIRIRQRINTNAIEKTDNSTFILLDEKVLPHTFLNYVFINKEDYRNRTIEDELYTHELTHVRQKHTLDILFVEILKIIFWFNPILILYKKAIQLNHEFLADEKVVKSYNNVPFYQNLLLQKASWNSNFYLASNLNFLVTKKRLIMMTTKTSRSKAIILQICVLPIAALLLFSCAVKTVAKIESEINATTSRIEVLNVSNSEMDSLQNSNPTLYAGKKADDYKKTRFTQLDKNGNITVNTSYDKNLEMAPIIVLPKIDVDSKEIAKIEIEYILATDPQVIALKDAHPEEFSKNPDASYKLARSKMTLKDSTIVEQIMFQRLSEL